MFNTNLYNQDYSYVLVLRQDMMTVYRVGQKISCIENTIDKNAECSYCWTSYYLQTVSHYLEFTLYLWASLPRSLNSFLTIPSVQIFAFFQYKSPYQTTRYYQQLFISGPFCVCTFYLELSMHTFVQSTYPPLNVTYNFIFSSLPLPSSCASASDSFSRFLALHKFMYVCM